MTASRPTLPDHDLELLSAYLDGQLSDRDRRALETRLSQDATLYSALQDLRDTVTLVRSLPRLKAPRDFTLDPALYAKPRPWWSRVFTLENTLQLSGALGVAASIVLIAFALVWNTPTGAPYAGKMTADQPDSAELVPQTALAMQAFSQDPETETPGSNAVDAAALPTMLPAETAIVQDGALPDAQFAAPAPAVGYWEDEPLAVTGESGIMAEEAAIAPAAPLQEAMRDQADQPSAAPPGAAAAPPPVAESPSSDKPPTRTLSPSPTAVSMLLTPSPTASASAPTSTHTPPSTTGRVGESDESENVYRARTDAPAPEQTKRPTWWLAGIGIALLAFSAGAFIAGRIKAGRR